ncbi:Oidioi.mRNA.OKI2018_I69.PAR.g9894.t1.cds [Oikopleura dioica]|uniref:Oidioi.mRNA.OKI2018_I69.PAR.g9894.t1.cds n=1 Tax=Oikopleura dioica TaxID=34765 RepID=A0ABN7RRF5_OIKDI|nr:Oidioi.mRNA.OKI2018_I69.PAR.g9894.t1.cds [Oikopleura dioica]
MITKNSAAHGLKQRLRELKHKLQGINDLRPTTTTTTTTTTRTTTTRPTITLPTLSSSTQSTSRTLPISPTLPAEKAPTLPPLPDFETIIDNFIDSNFPVNETDTIEFDYCSSWYGILGYGVPIPIRFSHKFAVLGLLTDGLLFLSAVYYGMSTIVYELMFFSTVLSVTKLLGLIGSIPVMLDVSCNCYSMIGSEGWIEVTGVVTKLGCVIALLFQAKGLPSLINLWEHQRIIENCISIIISALTLYSLISPTLFDSRGYISGFATEKWYGIWKICTGTAYDSSERCTTWDEASPGLWDPSSYWLRPRPIGFNYIALVNIIVSIFGILFCFLDSPKLRRIGIMFTALATFCLVTIAVYVIEGVPILTVPVLKYGPSFKGYYGSAWYSLAAAAGFGAINWLANSVCIFSTKEENQEENEKLKDEKNFIKI